MSKSSLWPQGIIKAAGSIIGMVLTVSGSIMIINNGLRAALFDSYSYNYTDFTYECQYDNFHGKLEDRTLRTKEEKESCIAEKKIQQKEQYDRSKLENMVDGIAPLIIGIFFWVMFRAKKED